MFNILQIKMYVLNCPAKIQWKYKKVIDNNVLYVLDWVECLKKWLIIDQASVVYCYTSKDRKYKIHSTFFSIWT